MGRGSTSCPESPEALCLRQGGLSGQGSRGSLSCRPCVPLGAAEDGLCPPSHAQLLHLLRQPVLWHAQLYPATRGPTSSGPLPAFSQVFDNEEFDCRTPQEWINMGLEPGSNARKPVPGKALLPTDDFLGHGEQGQPGVGCHLVPAAVLSRTPGLPWQPWVVRDHMRLRWAKELATPRPEMQGPGWTLSGRLGRGQLDMFSVKQIYKDVLIYRE